MSGMGRRLSLFIVLTAIAPASCRADGFKAMARELAGAAESAQIKRVAILPFSPADGSSMKDGWSISEKLTTQVVRLGKVQAVERSLLRDLMEEHHLAQTGMIDQAMLKRTGKIFSIEAVVAGSFVNLGGKAVVNARLINVETGVIIAAVERQVDREWFDTLASPRAQEPAASLWVSVPGFAVEAPPLPAQDLGEARDAVTEESCVGASERVDRLESRILDLKARYWALQLKKGVSLASVRVNPGSTISDPILKKAFYDRMKYWYGIDGASDLTPLEVQRFVALDEKAYELYHECGL